MSTSIPSPTSVATPSTIEPSFTQLARMPLVPERLLRKYGASCAIDTRFRAAARLLQCLWLRDHNISDASSDSASHSSFGSFLSATAARAGKNFLSADIHDLAREEWLFCEEGAAIDDERLFGNALSSMPLVFNLFGPLAHDLQLATAVFRALLPGFVHTVEQIVFEHSPGRREDRFLADRTAFDLAVRVITPDGEPATIYIELKFSESMEGPAARMRDRYDEASRQVGLYRDPDSLILRSAVVEQLWREGMMAQLAVDNGVTPRACFMVIGPQLNRQVQAACRLYEAELIQPDDAHPNRVPFVPLTLEAVIKAIGAASGTNLAQALWRRYCDFDRVYRLVLQETTAVDPAAPAERLSPDRSRRLKPARSATRRVSARRQPRNPAQASAKHTATKTTSAEAAR